MMIHMFALNNCDQSKIKVLSRVRTGFIERSALHSSLFSQDFTDHPPTATMANNDELTGETLAAYRGRKPTNILENDDLADVKRMLLTKGETLHGKIGC